MTKELKASDRVMEILRQAEIKDTGLVLTGQLDRADYDAVNKFLDLAGLKWNRSKKIHLFTNTEAHQKLVSLLDNGSLRDDKKHFQAYYTPVAVAELVIDLADIQPGMLVLEPSAGEGALASPAHRIGGGKVRCFELNDKAADVLMRMGFSVRRMDFLDATPEPVFDRVVMNPPFTTDQDIKHIMHAFEFLKPGGVLVSITAKGWMHGSNKLRTLFREFVDLHGGVVAEVPEGSFKESGTNIATVIVKLTMPE